MTKRNSDSKNQKEIVKSIIPKNEEQENMLQTIQENVITFVKGSPGSGKTHIAVGHALHCLVNKEYNQLVFTRPVVEAGGEKLGFLPGTMYEKIDPYMIPIFDSLAKFLPQSLADKFIHKNGNGHGKNGNGYGDLPIRVLPLAYMRGTTYNRSFVVGDEMQNSTPEQVRMLLTRLGKRSKMVLCGDVYQSDIRVKNGLFDAYELLQDIKGIGFVTLTKNAIVRHPIIQEVEDRYLDRDLEKKDS